MPAFHRGRFRIRRPARKQSATVQAHPLAMPDIRSPYTRTHRSAPRLAPFVKIYNRDFGDQFMRTPRVTQSLSESREITVNRCLGYILDRQLEPLNHRLVNLIQLGVAQLLELAQAFIGGFVELLRVCIWFLVLNSFREGVLKLREGRHDRRPLILDADLSLGEFRPVCGFDVPGNVLIAPLPCGIGPDALNLDLRGLLNVFTVVHEVEPPSVSTL